jgi:hypothetical protein
MISVDDIVKLLLAVSVAFAIVIIAYQISKLISETRGLVHDTRKPVNNVGEASDLLLDDYKSVRRITNRAGQYVQSLVPLAGLLNKAEPESESETDAQSLS